MQAVRHRTKLRYEMGFRTTIKKCHDVDMVKKMVADAASKRVVEAETE